VFKCAAHDLRLTVHGCRRVVLVVAAGGLASAHLLKAHEEDGEALPRVEQDEPGSTFPTSDAVDGSRMVRGFLLRQPDGATDVAGLKSVLRRIAGSPQIRHLGTGTTSAGAFIGQGGIGSSMKARDLD
jgi:hypothetical protein